MARRKIREYTAKKMLVQTLLKELPGKVSFSSVLVSPKTDLSSLQIPFSPVVVKPDMLFGKRKQYGLVLLDATPEEAKQWILQHQGKPYVVGEVNDVLTNFLIEPFLAHDQEFYLSLSSEREGDLLHFSSVGGAGIEERWNSVRSVLLSPGEEPAEKLQCLLAEESEKNGAKKDLLPFLLAAVQAFQKLHFSSLEINPFVVDNQGKVHLLDTVAEMDDCASPATESKNPNCSRAAGHSITKKQWIFTLENGSQQSCGVSDPFSLNDVEMEFPLPFGRSISTEERMIHALDQESGASLKLTLLNQEGKVWNILSGGGASIICLDELQRAGLGKEIATYGEYSGNPTPEESYQYAKTILQLMSKNTQTKKVLLIAGAIANFTDVEKTFSGIIRALEEYQEPLRRLETKIIVRRGGPNYEKGLRSMQEAGTRLGLDLEVYGPEMPLHKVAERVKEAVRGRNER